MTQWNGWKPDFTPQSAYVQPMLYSFNHLIRKSIFYRFLHKNKSTEERFVMCLPHVNTSEATSSSWREYLNITLSTAVKIYNFLHNKKTTQVRHFLLPHGSSFDLFIYLDSGCSISLIFRQSVLRLMPKIFAASCLFPFVRFNTSWIFVSSSSFIVFWNVSFKDSVWLSK